LPPGFDFPEDAQVFTPMVLGSAADPDQRASHGLSVVARLRDGVTLQRAQSEMNAIATRLALTYPESNTGWDATVVPLREQLLGSTSAIFVALLGAVAAVLLIACGNVANLQLAR